MFCFGWWQSEAENRKTAKRDEHPTMHCEIKSRYWFSNKENLSTRKKRRNWKKDLSVTKTDLLLFCIPLAYDIQNYLIANKFRMFVIPQKATYIFLLSLPCSSILGSDRSNVSNCSNMKMLKFHMNFYFVCCDLLISIEWNH